MGAVEDWTLAPVRSEAASADDIADLGALSQTRTRRGPHPAEGEVRKRESGLGSELTSGLIFQHPPNLSFSSCRGQVDAAPALEAAAGTSAAWPGSDRPGAPGLATAGSEWGTVREGAGWFRGTPSETQDRDTPSTWYCRRKRTGARAAARAVSRRAERAQAVS